MFCFSSDNIIAKFTLDFKEATNKNKKQIYVAKASVILNVKDFDFDFDDTEQNLAQFHEVMRNTINENKQDVIVKFVPNAEEAVSKLLIRIANNITYDKFEQLFPGKQ